MSPIRHLRGATIALVASGLVFNSGPTLATETQAYHVPWKVLAPDESGPGGPLGLLWFPASAAEAKESSLLTSRVLSIQSARCVTMATVAPDDVRLRSKYEIPRESAAVILVDQHDEVMAVVVPTGPELLAGPVEAMVQAELDRRENEAKAALEAANLKIKQKDADAAVALLKPIWAQRCLFPDLAKKAAKALKKLGQPVEVGDLRDWDDRLYTIAMADRDASARR